MKAGTVAIVGAGTIGTGWAAAFALKGWQVALYDPSAAQAQRASMAVGETLRASGIAADGRSQAGGCAVADSLEQALEDAEFVQEAVPDVLDLKREIFATASSLLAPTVPIASSTSTFRPSELLQGVPQAQRLLVGHPFHPVHIIPLVEVVGSPLTEEAAIVRATQVYEGIGKVVIRLRRECTGHLVNRLQVALFREATYLVAEGIATAQDVDRGIAYGPALRWPLTGLFMTWHLAGGPGGVHDYLAKLGPSIELMWRNLGDATLCAEVRERIEQQVLDAAAGRSLEQMSIVRDDLLAQLSHWLASRDRLI